MQQCLARHLPLHGVITNDVSDYTNLMVRIVTSFVITLYTSNLQTHIQFGTTT